MCAAPRLRHPLRLPRRLLALPFDHMPLDFAENRPILSPVEVLDDRVRMIVVVERLARREIEPAAAGVSDAGFPVFDYLRDVAIVAIIFGLKPEVEAAGIEPASADAPERASTSLSCALNSPAGRFAGDLPTD
jgi:hypothetical protein